MQKFKHNNTNIWVWKFCLLKIYLDYGDFFYYRLVDSKWMTKRDGYKGLEFFERGDYKNKRENSLEHSLLTLLSSQDFQLCLMRKLASLFIGEALGFKKTLSLSFFSMCMRIAEGKSPFLLFIFITLPLSHLFAFESLFVLFK